jgi:8-oxo-dGTP diphosphatase
MIPVCAAIIYKDNKILIAQRQGGDHHEYKWEFPGGKINEGESPEECIIREIKEELGVEIFVKNLFDVIHQKYDNRNIILIVYECIILSGDPRANECNDFKWVDVKDMKAFDFAEADMKIVYKLASRI